METDIKKEFVDLVKARYPKNAERILNVLDFAEKAHEGVKRKSGEPYIVHPLSVAKILIENNMDYNTVMAGLLHDVAEDTEYTIEDLGKLFGETVSKLVDGVTKIDDKTLKKSDGEDSSIRKLILSMGTDIRVILIKLADRLHNMQTIGFLSRERQIRMSNETNELFIPIAERLGIRNIRSELEELTFKCLHGEEYEKIKAEFDRRLNSRKKELEGVEKKIGEILKENGVSAKIFSWPEHYYSIYKKKIQSQGINKVYGLMLYKIIVEDELECYKVLGILHKNFRHIPAQIKDFISSPKPNGYRSLHTVLISSSGDVTFKVMIRTSEMDKICESGVSSIWTGRDVDESFSKQIEKYNKIKEITSNEDHQTNPSAFINAIKSDLFSSVTWVFTPKLKPICLNSDKPTAIDFAYALHTDIGHRAVGAIVSGKKASLATTLKAGDVVEILVSDEPKAPSRSWLQVAKTTGARQKITKYLSENSSKKAVNNGKKMLEEELKKSGYDIGSVLAVFDKIQKEYNFVSIDDMFCSIGLESVTVMQIASFVLKEDEKKKFLKNVPIEIEGISDFSSINYPKCCSAVPGDDIVAVVSKSGAVSVHRNCCANAKKVLGGHLFNAKWKEKIVGDFSSKLKIVASDEVGFGARLLSLLADIKVNLNKTVARKLGENDCEFEIGLQVAHVSELEEVIKKIEAIDGVKSVSRSFE